MPYNQKDLVWLKDPIPLPDGTELPHPVLIISCTAANSMENFYTGIMMTASAHKDKFSFPVTNEMFEGNLNKANCQLRLYLTVSFMESNIVRLENRMKKIHFKNVIEQIVDYVICVE